MTSHILPRSGLHDPPMFDFEVRLVLSRITRWRPKPASRRKI
ncbi:hypothetical protein ACNKHO_24470 [Shigella flexneri]